MSASGESLDLLDLVRARFNVGGGGEVAGPVVADDSSDSLPRLIITMTMINATSAIAPSSAPITPGRRV
jgi:hypothetical protein